MRVGVRVSRHKHKVGIRDETLRRTQRRAEMNNGTDRSDPILRTWVRHESPYVTGGAGEVVRVSPVPGHVPFLIGP